jgi:hypothetical protein
VDVVVTTTDTTPATLAALLNDPVPTTTSPNSAPQTRPFGALEQSPILHQRLLDHVKP